MLVGIVAMPAQWWLENRSMSKEEVAAHMVNLAWNGLRGMKAEPTLHSGPADNSNGSEDASGQGADLRTESAVHRHGATAAPGPASHEASQEAFADLVQQVELAGYYPELVLDTLRLATGEEEILSGMVQSETTFAEAVHRHLTVLALTPSPEATSSPRAMASRERARAKARTQPTAMAGSTGMSSSRRVRAIEPTPQVRTASNGSGSSSDRNMETKPWTALVD